MSIKISPNIDNIISKIGGFPRGHLIEVYGPDGEGKTSLAIIACASAQKGGLKVGYVDVEWSLDECHGKFLGLNFNELDWVKPNNGEEALNEVLRMCNDNYGLVIVDSVAGLIPESIAMEEEISIGGQYAQVASLLAKNLSKIRIASSLGKTCVIFINQIRANIRKFGMGPETESFGGYAIKHYVSARFEVRKVGWIKYSNETIGFKLRIRAPKKNRFTTPNRDGYIDIICDHDAPSLEKINERKKTKIEPIGGNDV